MSEPKIMIGMYCNELSRFSECYASLMAMDKPEAVFVQAIHGSLTRSLNNLGRHFLASKAEHLFLTNDDHIYAKDALTRLLAHDKDITCGLYLKRSFPYEPIVYEAISEHGARHRYLKSGERGLVRVAAGGGGAMLIKRRVLEGLPQPWWRLATIEPDLISEDLSFCKSAVDAGFEIWCDLDVRVGHIAVVPVFPHEQDGEWTTLLAVGGKVRIPIDPASRMQVAQLASKG